MEDVVHWMKLQLKCVSEGFNRIPVSSRFEERIAEEHPALIFKILPART